MQKKSQSLISIINQLPLSSYALYRQTLNPSEEKLLYDIWTNNPQGKIGTFRLANSIYDNKLYALINKGYIKKSEFGNSDWLAFTDKGKETISRLILLNEKTSVLDCKTASRNINNYSSWLKRCL